MRNKQRIDELIKISNGNSNREAVYQYLRGFLKKYSGKQVFSKNPPPIVFFKSIELAGINSDERERYLAYFRAAWSHTIAQYKNPEIFASLCISQMIIFLREGIEHGNYDYRFIDDDEKKFTSVAFRTPIGSIEEREFLYLIEDSIYNICHFKGIENYVRINEIDGELYIKKNKCDVILECIIDLAGLSEMNLEEEVITAIYQCLEKRFEYYIKNLKKSE